MSSTRPDAPSRDELIREVAEYFVGYIGAGASMEPFADDFTPNLKVSSLEELLEYYFLLTGKVSNQTSRSEVNLSESIIEDTYGVPIGILDFTSLLANRIRSLDPEIQPTTEIFRGEARGRIDWNQTIKHRYNTGDSNSQLFACQVQKPSLDSPRNRVLVELLTQIEKIFTRFDNRVSTDESFEWFRPWLRSRNQSKTTIGRHDEPDEPTESPNLRAVVKTALNQSQLSSLNRKSVEVSDKVVRQVQSDRTPLYREAAELLALHRRLKRGKFNEDIARSFLGSQVVHPPNDTEMVSMLFEMYWIFNLIDTFEHAEHKLFEMNEDEDLIGQWRENDSTYLIFNDWDGKYDGNEYLSFDLPSTETLRMSANSDNADEVGNSNTMVENDLHQRLGFMLANKYLFERQVLGHNPTEKTPDIVLLRCEEIGASPVIESVFIGEVKHSTNAETLREGTLQLLEYGAFARIGDDAELSVEHNGPYLASNSPIVDSPNLELGYFVGHRNALSRDDFANIQVRGFGQSPTEVLQS